MSKSDEGKTTDAKDPNKGPLSAPNAPPAPKGPTGDGTQTTSQSQPVNTAPNVQSTNSLAPAPTTDPDVRSQLSDNTFKPGAAPETSPNELSKEEQDKLDALLGDDDESTEPDRPAVARNHEASAITKLRKLVAAIPSETPNEHPVWGAAGISLQVGDLRELVKSLA